MLGATRSSPNSSSRLGAALSLDPAQLRDEIQELTGLIDESRALERSEVESKMKKLREVLTKWGIFDDPKMKLLIFTEHKDTLDYLAGDGRDERPKGKLVEWGLKVTQIHGGMKIGDRDTAGAAIPDFPNDGKAVEFDPRGGARERMLEARYVGLPGTNVEVKSVPPILPRVGVLRSSVGCDWRCL